MYNRITFVFTEYEQTYKYLLMNLTVTVSTLNLLHAKRSQIKTRSELAAYVYQSIFTSYRIRSLLYSVDYFSTQPMSQWDRQIRVKRVATLNKAISQQIPKNTSIKQFAYNCLKPFLNELLTIAFLKLNSEVRNP